MLFKKTTFEVKSIFGMPGWGFICLCALPFHCKIVSDHFSHSRCHPLVPQSQKFRQLNTPLHHNLQLSPCSVTGLQRYRKLIQKDESSLPCWSPISSPHHHKVQADAGASRWGWVVSWTCHAWVLNDTKTDDRHCAQIPTGCHTEAVGQMTS